MVKNKFNLSQKFRARSFLVLSFFIGATLAFISRMAHGEVLFEGYSKVLAGKKQVGFTIAKYEYNEKKKQFVATTFLKTNQMAGNLTESIKAVADDGLNPISYHYTTLVEKQAKTIDAIFKNHKMTATINEKGKTKKITINLPKDKQVFLSTFLVYVMLKSPTGLQDDSTYNYEAIAEEDAAIYKGSAIVKGSETVNGINTLKVQNNFKEKFDCLVTNKGEIIATKAPTVDISTELVAKAADATEGFQVPNGVLMSLFGDIPAGIKNEVARKALVPAGSPTKQEGVPAGKGIQIKTESISSESGANSQNNTDGSGK